MGNVTDENAILESARENKLILPKDLENIKGARVHLSRLVKSGKLIKIGRGLYSLAENDFNEQQTLLETNRLVPKGVICLLSALRFHELTTNGMF